MFNGPNSVEVIQVILRTFDDELYDITPIVTEIALFEGISNYFVEGEIAILDNSGILASYPLIGQERIEITIKRKNQDKFIRKEFFLTGPQNVAQVNVGTGGILMSMTSINAVINAQSIFSRSYSGLNTDLIAQIYKDFFEIDVTVQSIGGSSHNIVFPYMKPLQALDYIISKTSSVDNSPLFLYERLYDNDVILKSFSDMYKEDPIDVTSRISANTNAKGSSTIDAQNQKGLLSNVHIEQAYNAFYLLDNGFLSHKIEEIDYNNKKFTEIDFNYSEHSNVNSEDFITDQFKQGINTKSLAKINYKAPRSFETLQSISSKDSLSKSSYRTQETFRNNINIIAHGDHAEGLSVGETLYMKYPKFMPMLSTGDDSKDKINSGVFVVNEIIHKYSAANGGKYEVELMLSRDGINDDRY